MIDDIQNRLIEAMKVGDKRFVTILRDIKGNLAEAEKIKSKALTKQECMDVLGRMAKKRKQSIAACGDNFKYQEMKENEIFELSVIEEYLPTKMPLEEIKDEIVQLIDLDNISHGLKNLGEVMKKFNDMHPNQDGKVVSKIARELLSA
jgi:uncharacterized protein YqeY